MVHTKEKVEIFFVWINDWNIFAKISFSYLGDEVVDAVDEQVEGREAARQVAAPPPVIVLEFID